MTRAISNDLRERIVARYLEEGESYDSVAEHFQVGRRASTSGRSCSEGLTTNAPASRSAPSELAGSQLRFCCVPAPPLRRRKCSAAGARTQVVSHTRPA
jgi:transposase